MYKNSGFGFTDCLVGLFAFVVSILITLGIFASLIYIAFFIARHFGVV